MALKKLLTDLTQGLKDYPNHNTPLDSGGFNYGGSTSVFDAKLFQQRILGYNNPNSRQDNPSPLIPQLLPEVNQEPENSILYLDDSPDGYLRGGIMNTLKRASYDNIRMNRFFKTGTGITFIEIQKSLQRSNPIIQEGGGNINNTLEDILNIVAGTNFTTSNTNRTFNVNNLLKQITEGGYTGNYYNRAGSNEEIQSRPENKYEASHKPGSKFDANTIGNFDKTGGLESGNRLISLGKKLALTQNFNLETQTSLMKQAVGWDVGEALDFWKDIKTGFNSFINDPLETLSKPGEFTPNDRANIGFQPGENILYQYSGGPGSTYGIGDTIIYRYERTSGDFDHQGHPLSFKAYFELQKHTQISGKNIQFYGADGKFDSSVGLNFLANTVNQNLFGGNNILGAGGLLFDDDFNFNPLSSGPNNILEGLGRQILGDNTTNVLKDIFDGGGFGGFGTPFPEFGEQIEAGSYSLGFHQDIGGLIGAHFDLSLKSLLTGVPTSGFIPSTRSSTGRGIENKPDDIAFKLKTKKNVDFNVGKILTFAEIIKTTSNKDRYKPTPSQMKEDGKARYPNTHYYSTILSNKANIESRVGTGSPGQGEGDTINKLPIEYGEYNDLTADSKYNDLVKFRFEAVDPTPTMESSAMGDRYTGNNSNIIAFRAFLDNFGDDYSSNWNSFKYNGRGEDFYTYGGFKRKFSFSFKIAAQSSEEMQPLYTKLNYLVSNLAPEYSTNGRMKAPYIKLTIGDYMNRTPGFLTSMNIKWQKDYPWEIMMPPGFKSSRYRAPRTDRDRLKELPQVLDVSCQFTPIHDFVPRKSIKDSPFIIPKDYIMGGGEDSKEIMSLQPPSYLPTITETDFSEELKQFIAEEAIRFNEEMAVTTFAPVSTNVSQNNYGLNKYMEEQFITDPTLNYTINGITYDQFGNDLTSDLIWED